LAGTPGRCLEAKSSYQEGNRTDRRHAEAEKDGRCA
jgi:hypothetical protein